MNARVTAIVLAILLGAFVLKDAISQDKAHIVVEKEVPGRYMAVKARNHPLIVCDTATGHCWQYGPADRWYDLGSPKNPKVEEKGEEALEETVEEAAKAR